MEFIKEKTFEKKIHTKPRKRPRYQLSFKKKGRKNAIDQEKVLIKKSKKNAVEHVNDHAIDQEKSMF